MTRPAEEPRCPNCGTLAAGPFCAQCGQQQSPLLPTVLELARNTVGELFDLDSRWVRSSLALVRYPGRLSVEWIEGRRAMWTSPLRLYLITAALFFFLLEVVGPTGEGSSVMTEAATGLVAGALASDAEQAEAAIREGMELLPPAFLLLVPLAAGLLGSALRSKKRRFVEHLVTLVHVHAFAFLAWAPVGPVRLGTGVDAGGLVTVALVWHVARAFRTVYGRLSIRLWLNVVGVFLIYYISMTMALGVLGIVGAAG